MLGGGAPSGWRTSSSPGQVARCLVVVSKGLGVPWLRVLPVPETGRLAPGVPACPPPDPLAADRPPDPELLVIRQGHGGMHGVGEGREHWQGQTRTASCFSWSPPVGPGRSCFLLFWVALPLQGAHHPIPGGQAGVSAVRVPVQAGAPVPGGVHPGGGRDGGQTGLGAVFASFSSCLK